MNIQKQLEKVEIQKKIAFIEKIERIDKACNILNENITRIETIFQPVIGQYINEECMKGECMKDECVESPTSQFDSFINDIEKTLFRMNQRINDLITRSAI